MSSAEDLNTLVKLLHDADVTRYLSIVGAITLLYDHGLTFAQEIDLIWNAPASFAKFAFLTNRYLVPGCMLVVSYDMCGFSSTHFTDLGCRQFLFVVSMFAVCSIGLGNVLVLLRMILLWEGNRLASRLMTIGFLCSWTTTAVMLVLALIHLFPGIQWYAPAHMCVLTTSTPFLVAAWAFPMCFEILVLVSVCVNAFMKPRDADVSLRKSLQRDGIQFFLALSSLRALNVSLASTMNPALELLGVFFVWSMVVVVLNRSLLSLRRAEEQEKKTKISPNSRRGSLFTHSVLGRVGSNKSDRSRKDGDEMLLQSRPSVGTVVEERELVAAYTVNRTGYMNIA